MKRAGQYSFEYAAAVVIVTAAAVGMSIYVKRAMTGRWRVAADTFGQGRQYGVQATVGTFTAGATFGGNGCQACDVGRCQSTGAGPCYFCPEQGATLAEAQANALASDCAATQRGKGYPFCGFCAS